MQIPYINRYLLSIYEESVLKVFKHFRSEDPKNKIWHKNKKKYGMESSSK